jgi:ethanolamine utilization protein EutQ (cupin superfamily)
MTNKIYVVNLDAKGNMKSKVDVTQQVINAVMKHMHLSKENYICEAGELLFVPKGDATDEK